MAEGKMGTRRQEIDRLLDAFKFRHAAPSVLHTGLSPRELARAVGVKLPQNGEVPLFQKYRGYTLMAKAKLT